MRVCGVLHPRGWDAFGLPAENYAIKHGVHPRVTTAAAIANFRRQIDAVGVAYDWGPEGERHAGPPVECPPRRRSPPSAVRSTPSGSRTTGTARWTPPIRVTCAGRSG